MLGGRAEKEDWRGGALAGNSIRNKAHILAEMCVTACRAGVGRETGSVRGKAAVTQDHRVCLSKGIKDPASVTAGLSSE